MNREWTGGWCNKIMANCIQCRELSPNCIFKRCIKLHIVNKLINLCIWYLNTVQFLQYINYKSLDCFFFFTNVTVLEVQCRKELERLSKLQMFCVIIGSNRQKVRRKMEFSSSSASEEDNRTGTCCDITTMTISYRLSLDNVVMLKKMRTILDIVK